MDEGDKLSAEGKQTNIDKDTQQLPVTMENQRYGGNEEEGQRRARWHASQRESQLEAKGSIILKSQVRPSNGLGTAI